MDRCFVNPYPQDSLLELLGYHPSPDTEDEDVLLSDREVELCEIARLTYISSAE